MFSSMPIAVRIEDGSTAIDRLRQAVSPAGELTESMDTVVLDQLEPGRLESEASDLFRVLSRRTVPEDDRYLGSTIVMLEAV